MRESNEMPVKGGRIRVGVLVVVAVIALPLLVFVYGVRQSLVAEGRLHSYCSVCLVVEGYLDHTNGKWPTTREDLIQYDPPPDLDVYISCDWPEDADRVLNDVEFDFGVNICDVELGPFVAIRPIPGPTYVNSTDSSRLADAVARWQEYHGCGMDEGNQSSPDAPAVEGEHE